MVEVTGFELESATRTPRAGALADDPAETVAEVTWIRKAAFRRDLSE
jgi:hypothetical protein